MAATLKHVHYSNRELERAILTEAGGCDMENKKNEIFNINTDVILISNALAKKLLGIYGVDIGNDPAKAALLKPKDFDALRSAIKPDDPWRAEKLRDIAEEENEKARTDAAQDKNAWAEVKEMEERIMLTAAKLAKVGLVEVNIDTLTPDSVRERDIGLGGDGKIPLNGSIVLTDKGKNFLSSGKQLREKKRWFGSKTEELEIY